MYVQVRLSQGYREPLLYRVPEHLKVHIMRGVLVKVPFRKQIIGAFVECVIEELPKNITYQIRELESATSVVHDKNYIPFIEKLSTYCALPSYDLLKRTASFLQQPDLKRKVASDATKIQATDLSEKLHNVALTPDQEKIYQAILPFITQPSYAATLIHGVTGSGKTEIYKKLIELTTLHQKTTLLLLPEVTLAVQFYTLLKKTLPSTIATFMFHSATSAAERRALLKALLHEQPVLILGVHLPIMLPIKNLGLIVVDEEHETGYQEKKHPKINTKEAAIMRAQIYGIPIVLGSATPSISSLNAVKKHGWNFFQLTQRFGGKFPTVNIVSLVQNRKRQNFWITKELLTALEDRIIKKEQAIIFINRRGYSFFVQCQTCSHIQTCSACSVSLTLHENTRLICHYCGYKTSMPETCAVCKKSEFIKKGIGTQQIVSILQKLLPTARIGRADMDSTVNKKEWQQTLNHFSTGDIDILVGTQTITKGYDFPNVTLVGIIWADLNLHFPVYNAAEVALQQLLQVAGRAGRARDESLVIVQTMLDHPIFKFCNEIDYLKFYAYELQKREETYYPPIIRLSEIELKNSNENEVDCEANNLFDELYGLAQHHAKNIQILGPALPPVAKIQHIHSRTLYIKAQNFSDILFVYRKINHARYKSSIYFTPNPLD